MTYCLAMRLDEGLLFLSDTRTNAGVDNISTYRKLHVFEPTADRGFVLQSAGTLATTQEVLDRIAAELAAGTSPLPGVDHLHDAALYIGRLGTDVADRHRAALDRVGADGTATFVLGGQVTGEAPDIMLIYPEGNYIRASDDRPFLQIGETKYGKAWLDLAVRSNADLPTAAKVALSSMESTTIANLSVGPPYDLGIYERDSFRLLHARIDGDAPYLDRLRAAWAEHLLAAVDALPPVEPGEITFMVPDSG